MSSDAKRILGTKPTKARSSSLYSTLALPSLKQAIILHDCPSSDTRSYAVTCIHTQADITSVLYLLICNAYSTVWSHTRAQLNTSNHMLTLSDFPFTTQKRFTLVEISEEKQLNRKKVRPDWKIIHIRKSSKQDWTCITRGWMREERETL